MKIIDFAAARARLRPATRQPSSMECSDGFPCVDETFDIREIFTPEQVQNLYGLDGHI